MGHAISHTLMKKQTKTVIHYECKEIPFRLLIWLADNQLKKVLIQLNSVP